MKQLKSIGHLLCCLTALAGVSTSCMSENYPEADTSASGHEVNVKVTLTMSATAPKSYAISSVDENHVETIDVLVFKQDTAKPSGWAFSYKAQGAAITDATGDNPVKAKKQFSVTLIKSPKRQTLVILVNVRSEVSGLGEIATGTDKDLLLTRLVSENTGSWNANNDGAKEDIDPTRFAPFPMWGQVKQILTDGVSTIDNVNILRGVARIDVVLGDNVIEANNFTLDKVYIYNSKNKGYIVPANVNFETATRVNAATVPADAAAYTAWNNASPLIYTVPEAMKTAFERTIYLYEADGKPENESSKATCIVVGGIFGTDNTATYYRLDFLKKTDADGYFRDILRNHKYRINIKSVTGRGYDTPEEAFNSKAINIVIEITEWDDGGMGDVVFDGQYALSISPARFDLSSDALNSEVVKNKLAILTDYPTGWAIPDTNIVDAVTGEAVAWLKVKSGNPGAVVTNGAKDIKANLWLEVEQNTLGLDRSAKIIVIAGRLRYPVIVNQSSNPPIGLDVFKVVNSTETPVTELLFASGADVQPEAQILKVNWMPATANLMVTINQVGGAALFPASSGAPSQGMHTGGAGTVTYTIQPPALTSAELDADPFLEKVSKVDFMVSDGIEYESKSMLLKQIGYVAVAEPESYYQMDGTRKSFKIKANAAWSAAIVDNPNNVISNITLSGDPNINPGSDFEFTIINDLANPVIHYAKASVRFSSPEGKFADRIVEIDCVSATLKGRSNSYMTTTNAQGIVFPVSRANEGGLPGSIGPKDILTAELVWTDHAGGVKRISGKSDAAIQEIRAMGRGSDGYVYVRPANAEGNAVVAVKVNGAIKWSWHIWVTNYAGTQVILHNGYIFMDRHLGSFVNNSANTVDYGRSGLFYQWGRKDPFPGAAGTAMYAENSITVYNAGGDIISGFAKATAPGTSVPRGNRDLSISNPFTFYHTSLGDWYSGSSSVADNTLWGTVKTVYDPCPEGWHVPPSDAFTGFSPAALNWIKGYTFPSLGYYPGSGYVNCSGGGLMSVNFQAYAWSCTADGLYSFTLTLYSSRTYLIESTHRGYGYPVRCVKE